MIYQFQLTTHPCIDFDLETTVDNAYSVYMLADTRETTNIGNNITAYILFYSNLFMTQPKRDT